MPVKGLKEVRQAMKQTFGEIKGPMVEKAITEVLIVAAGYAATMTPIDTSNLINSQYRLIRATGKGVSGFLGYTAAYAAAVHDSPGTLLGKGVPRDPNNSSRGNVWDKTGEPGFLAKAFEDPKARADIDAVVARHMQI
jgi:hypothetical protein